MVSPQEGGRLIFCRKLLLFLFGGIGVRESPFWDWGHPGRWDPNSQHGGWAGWSLLPQPQAALVKWAGCRHFLQAGPARARPRHSGLQERCTPPPGADPRTYKLCGEKQRMGTEHPAPRRGNQHSPWILQNYKLCQDRGSWAGCHCVPRARMRAAPEPVERQEGEGVARMGPYVHREAHGSLSASPPAVRTSRKPPVPSTCPPSLHTCDPVKLSQEPRPQCLCIF